MFCEYSDNGQAHSFTIHSCLVHDITITIAMSEPMVFVTEKRRVTMRFYQKIHFDLAKSQRTTTMAGEAEKRPETLCFVKKIHVEHVFSVQNRRVRRPFRYQNRGCVISCLGDLVQTQLGKELSL